VRLGSPSSFSEEKMITTISSEQGLVPERASIEALSVTGGYTYVDPYGEALGYEDVFTKLEHATKHYEAVGFGEDYVRRIVR
jgi:hypothetical protein